MALVAYAGRDTNAHKETCSTQKCSLQKCSFAHSFIHIIPNSDEFRSNVGQKKYVMHTQTLKKLEGTLPGTDFAWEPDIDLESILLLLYA